MELPARRPGAGLGSTWTTIQGFYEEDAARLLGIPYAEVQQIGLICLAHTKGGDFRPAPREPLAEHVHWEAW